MSRWGTNLIDTRLSAQMKLCYGLLVLPGRLFDLEKSLLSVLLFAFSSEVEAEHWEDLQASYRRRWTELDLRGWGLKYKMQTINFNKKLCYFQSYHFIKLCHNLWGLFIHTFYIYPSGTVKESEFTILQWAHMYFYNLNIILKNICITINTVCISLKLPFKRTEVIRTPFSGSLYHKCNKRILNTCSICWVTRTSRISCIFIFKPAVSSLLKLKYGSL